MVDRAENGWNLGSLGSPTALWEEVRALRDRVAELEARAGVPRAREREEVVVLVELRVEGHPVEVRDGIVEWLRLEADRLERDGRGEGLYRLKFPYRARFEVTQGWVDARRAERRRSEVGG